MFLHMAAQPQVKNVITVQLKCQMNVSACMWINLCVVEGLTEISVKGMVLNEATNSGL